MTLYRVRIDFSNYPKQPRVYEIPVIEETEKTYLVLDTYNGKRRRIRKVSKNPFACKTVEQAISAYFRRTINNIDLKEIMINTMHRQLELALKSFEPYKDNINIITLYEISEENKVYYGNDSYYNQAQIKVKEYNDKLESESRRLSNNQPD